LESSNNFEGFPHSSILWVKITAQQSYVRSSLSKSAFCGRIPIILAVKYGTKILHSNYIRGQGFPFWSNYYPEHWFLVSNLEKKAIFLTIFLSVFFVPNYSSILGQ
jgi:hypothetical protein